MTMQAGKRALFGSCPLAHSLSRRNSGEHELSIIPELSALEAPCVPMVEKRRLDVSPQR